MSFRKKFRHRTFTAHGTPIFATVTVHYRHITDKPQTMHVFNTPIREARDAARFTFPGCKIYNAVGIGEMLAF